MRYVNSRLRKLLLYGAKGTDGAEWFASSESNWPRQPDGSRMHNTGNTSIVDYNWLNAAHTANPLTDKNAGDTAPAGVYRLEYTVTGRTAGSLTPNVHGVDGTANSASGVKTEEITVPTPNVTAMRIYFSPSSDFDGSLSGINVQRVSTDP